MLCLTNSRRDADERQDEAACTASGKMSASVAMSFNDGRDHQYQQMRAHIHPYDGDSPLFRHRLKLEGALPFGAIRYPARPMSRIGSRIGRGHSGSSSDFAAADIPFEKRFALASSLSSERQMT